MVVIGVVVAMVVIGVVVVFVVVIVLHNDRITKILLNHGNFQTKDDKIS